MNMLAEWLQEFGSGSLGVFWLPLGVWTVVALLVMGALYLWRSAHPLIHYRAYLALLMALPLGFALAPFLPGPSLAPPPIVTVTAATPPVALPPVELPLPVADLPDPGVTWGMMHALGLLTLLVAALAMIRLLALLHHTWRLSRPDQGHTLIDNREVVEQVDILARRLAIKTPIRLHLGAQGSVPMTFGWLRPVIILPPEVLEDGTALHLTLLHELTHIRRRDYLTGWVEQLVCGVFAFHPGVWLLTRRITHFRELTCDAEVLDRHPVRAVDYARLLIGLHPGSRLATAPFMRMVPTESNLKQRIKIMKSHTQHSALFKHRSRYLSLLSAALLLALPAVFVACSSTISNTEIAIEEAAETDELLIEDIATAKATMEANLRAAKMELQQTRGDLTQKIMRHEIQMDYLMEQIRQLDATLKSRTEQDESMTTHMLRERANLLTNLYRERMYELETWKLEQIADRALGEQQARAEFKAREAAELAGRSAGTLTLRGNVSMFSDDKPFFKSDGLEDLIESIEVVTKEGQKEIHVQMKSGTSERQEQELRERLAKSVPNNVTFHLRKHED